MISKHRFSMLVGASIACVLVGAGTVEAADGDVRLVRAARARDGRTLGSLIREKADVNAREGDGTTPLHWTVYWNDAASAEQLIRAGASVNAANDLGITPLFLASTHEDPTLAKRLLAAGADPNLAASRGESPLMAAARTGRVETVRALLDHGAAVNARESTHDQTALMWSVVNRQPDVVRALVRAGADVNARSRVRVRKAFIQTNRQASYDPGAYERHVSNGEIVDVEEGGYTPLLFAAQQGDVESATVLLAAGADANDTAPSGMSALVVSAYSDRLDLGKLLLLKGADPNAAAAGYSALHAAILKGNLEFVKALLSGGADPNGRITRANGARRQSADYGFGHTLVGASPAFLAAKFAEIAILRALAAGGADLTFAMPEGTPLQGMTLVMAAMDIPETDSGDVEGLGKDRRDRYVFFRRVDTKSPDEFNVQTPEEVEGEVLEILNICLAARIDVNRADQNGDTAMHFAAAKGLNRTIELLVSRGADVNAQNERRQTPLDMAEAPRRNRGGDQLGHQAATAVLLRALGGEEGGEPVPDLRPRRAPR